MPFFRASLKDLRLHIIQIGDFTFAQSLDRWGEALAGAPDGVLILLDVRAATANRSASELRDFAHHLSASGKLGPRMAVIAGDPLHWGLARMFSAFCDDHPRVGVFANETEAIRWLHGSGQDQQFSLPRTAHSQTEGGPRNA